MTGDPEAQRGLRARPGGAPREAGDEDRPRGQPAGVRAGLARPADHRRRPRPCSWSRGRTTPWSHRRWPGASWRGSGGRRPPRWPTWSCPGPSTRSTSWPPSGRRHTTLGVVRFLEADPGARGPVTAVRGPGRRAGRPGRCARPGPESPTPERWTHGRVSDVESHIRDGRPVRAGTPAPTHPTIKGEPCVLLRGRAVSQRWRWSLAVATGRRPAAPPIRRRPPPTRAPPAGRLRVKIPQSAFSDHTGRHLHLGAGGQRVHALPRRCSRAPRSAPRPTSTTSTPRAGSTAARSWSTAADDGFTGAGNKQATQNALQNDFALVGDFSLEDSFGGTVLAQNPGFPDVSQVLDDATNKLPNVFSPSRWTTAGHSGPIEYYKTSSRRGPARRGLPGRLALGHPDVGGREVRGREGGLQLRLRADVRRDPDRLHPASDRHEERRGQDHLHRPDARQLRLVGAEGAGPAELPPPGAARGGHLLQPAGLRSRAAPPTWTAPTSRRTSPSTWAGRSRRSPPSPRSSTGSRSPPRDSTPTCSPLYGWLSADLFAQALKNAGSDPSRGSLLQALSKVTVVQRRRHQRPVQPGDQDAAELLPDRHGDQRPVRAVVGQPADLQQHQRVPVRRLVHRQARDLSRPGRVHETVREGIRRG